LKKTCFTMVLCLVSLLLVSILLAPQVEAYVQHMQRSSSFPEDTYIARSTGTGNSFIAYSLVSRSLMSERSTGTLESLTDQAAPVSYAFTSSGVHPSYPGSNRGIARSENSSISPPSTTPEPSPEPEPQPEPEPKPEPPAEEETEEVPSSSISLGSYGRATSGSSSPTPSFPSPQPRPDPGEPVPEPEPEPDPEPEPEPEPEPTPDPEPEPEPEPEPSPDPGDVDELNAQEEQLLDLVNREREERGLSSLKVDQELTRLARKKSQCLIDNNYFAHESPTYGSPADMIRNAGISFRLASENLGRGGNIEGIFHSFMGSTGHKNNIVNERYNYTGIGIIYEPGRGYLVTQLFVEKS